MMTCDGKRVAFSRAAALLLAGVLLAGLAAVTAAAPTPSTELRAGAPKVFRMVLGGDALTLDPALGNDLQAIMVASNLYSTLVRADAEGNFYPDAAKSWRISPDGRTWTFVLRDNLKFHNGRAATAHDVKSPNNWTNYNSPDYDRLLDQALRIVDPKARTRALQQAEARAIGEDLALVPLMHSEFLYLKKPHVKGIETFTMGLGLLPFRGIAIEK